MPPSAAGALAAVVALVADDAILVPAAVTAYVIAVRRRWRTDLLEAALAGILTVVLVQIAGHLYAHPRPFVVWGTTPLVPHGADNAFPSDHLAACGLAFGYLAGRRRPAAALTLLFALLIGAARVYAQLHWPLDVVAGFALGATAAYAAQGILSAAQRGRAA
ncbi:MAG TPA: phosphatase PAP2 family protein [Candidatus Dormibacteraeota bacterium]|nr:phosphatase PAP2 family protein [Candidatus Dormibacteraeota bacterium]